jgi:hypothetical protein
VVQGLITTVSDILINVAGVYVARISQSDPVFPDSHGVLVKVGYAVSGGIPQIAEGQATHWSALDQMRGNYLLSHFWGNIAVEYPGTVGKLYVHQRFGKA